MASFQASKKFMGRQDGMEFKLGEMGLGYYESSSKIIELPLEFEAPREFVVGMRVQDEDFYFATVKFVGAVTTKKKTSIYIGVEWDEPSRGKHDGSVDGVEYFKTTFPGAGSLLKPGKLKRGVTFTESLKQAEYPPCTNVHAILKSTRVDRAGAAPPQPEEAQLAFINLEDNLLSTFDDAFQIAARCPGLEILRLGKNFFLPQSPSCSIPPLQNLHSITLTMCRLANWNIIEDLSSIMPNLIELSLAGNPDLLLNQMPSNESKFPQLKLLEMSNTGIDQWKQCEALLITCPLLSTLNLTRNKLVTLSDENMIQGSGGSGANLLDLVLDGNMVSNWIELHAINSRFPDLKSLGFVQNPCASGLDRRRLDRAVIPIMSSIVQLDGNLISSENRQEIEKQFLVTALRTSVAEAIKLISTDLSTNFGSNMEEGIVPNADVGISVRIPPLEEFVELVGAKLAMDKVLTQLYPHFFGLAEKHGNPKGYDRMVQLANADFK